MHPFSARHLTHLLCGCPCADHGGAAHESAQHGLVHRLAHLGHQQLSDVVAHLERDQALHKVAV